MSGFRVYKSNFIYFLVAVMISSLLGACGIYEKNSENMLAPQATNVDDKVDHAAESGMDAINKMIRLKLPYKEVRFKLLSTGWKPKKNSECRSNSFGAYFDKECKSDPSIANCDLCDELQELQECSGDGYCNMLFIDGKSGRELHISTYGDISGWNKATVENDLHVKSADVQH